MLNLLSHKMVRLRIFIILSSVTLSHAIRVDWNTNKGPIVPPTSTVPPVPRLPYREPAPVWEEQNDDIPNPNPYRYILPPPSRPRSANWNNQQQNTQPVYGELITKNNANNDRTVSSLAAQYIPNVGTKYIAVIPSGQSKNYYLNDNDIYDNKYEKFNSRYNAKLKKYKAYEKLMQFQQQNLQSNQLYYQLQLPYIQQKETFYPPQSVISTASNSEQKQGNYQQENQQSWNQQPLHNSRRLHNDENNNKGNYFQQTK